MTVLVTAGTEIRDDDGALVATVARDLHAGAFLEPADIRLADGAMLARGERVPVDVWRYLVRVGAL